MPRVVNPRFDIDVTQDLIDGAKPSYPLDCPLGRAIAQAVGIPAEFGRISVVEEGVYLSDRSGRLRKASGRLPLVARQFLARFDARLPVGPIRFRMAIRTHNP